MTRPWHYDQQTQRQSLSESIRYTFQSIQKSLRNPLNISTRGVSIPTKPLPLLATLETIPRVFGVLACICRMAAPTFAGNRISEVRRPSVSTCTYTHPESRRQRVEMTGGWLISRTWRRTRTRCVTPGPGLAPVFWFCACPHSALLLYRFFRSNASLCFSIFFGNSLRRDVMVFTLVFVKKCNIRGMYYGF